MKLTITRGKYTFNDKNSSSSTACAILITKIKMLGLRPDLKSPIYRTELWLWQPKIHYLRTRIWPFWRVKIRYFPDIWGNFRGPLYGPSHNGAARYNSFHLLERFSPCHYKLLPASISWGEWNTYLSISKFIEDEAEESSFWCSIK